ncbi:RNA ligase family protein [Kitasatospora sp. NPDC001261]|uniref:RNA ligase family protein n=1 Tax=Kitasatospora sp. NPDC001261 TaxID=3364012 RepID=UPI0036C8E2C6
MSTLNLAALHSATKYPSILTYHALGHRGALLEEATPFHGEVVATEKIDGANGRIIVMPDGQDYVIGSREELFHAKGDRVFNPAARIVEALKPLADRLTAGTFPLTGDRITTLYLEVYGSQVGAAHQQYAGEGSVGYRLFDVSSVDAEVLEWEQQRIVAWRDRGGQDWWGEGALQNLTATEGIPLTPRLAVLQGDELPTSVEAMHQWLTAILPSTLVPLDQGAGGQPEGVVLRSSDRTTIAKARFVNYEKTLRHNPRQAQGRKKPATTG